VLVPLLELEPDLALPDGTVLGERLAELDAASGAAAVRRAGPPLL